MKSNGVNYNFANYLNALILLLSDILFSTYFAMLAVQFAFFFFSLHSTCYARPPLRLAARNEPNCNTLRHARELNPLQCNAESQQSQYVKSSIFFFYDFASSLARIARSAIIPHTIIAHTIIPPSKYGCFTRTFDEGRKKRDLVGASCGNVPPFFFFFFFFVTGDLRTRRWQCAAVLVAMAFSLL